MTPRRRRAAALAMLRHLVEHCVEGREPRAFVAGADAYRSDTLRWAAKSLGYPWLACAADCRDPDHVTLLTAPLEEEVDR
jgi:hypothetical protein